MSKAIHIADSKSTILGGFPAKVAPIEGNPTLREQIQILWHIMNCAQSHYTDHSTMNWLYVCLPADLYKRFTIEAYPVPPASPGDNSRISENNNATENERIKHKYDMDKNHYLEDKHMNQALIDRLSTLVSTTN